MQPFLEKLPKTLATYLLSLMAEEGFDTDAEKRSWFIKGWLKKRALFDKIVEHNGFALVDKIEKEFKYGFLIITYSGSLITVSARRPDGSRDVLYESIKLRQDEYPNMEEKSIYIDFPVFLNKPLILNGARLVKTSPVFSIAVEEETLGSGSEAEQRFRIIGERISRALLATNKALFTKHSVKSELEKREDLFRQWTVLSWFRTGGWEEDIFIARAHLLWTELFSNIYNRLTPNIKDAEKKDQIFLEIVNQKFTRFCDIYKWIESEKNHQDIGLMKALEELPSREEFREFITKTGDEILYQE